MVYEWVCSSVYPLSICCCWWWWWHPCTYKSNKCYFFVLWILKDFPTILLDWSIFLYLSPIYGIIVSISVFCKFVLALKSFICTHETHIFVLLLLQCIYDIIYNLNSHIDMWVLVYFIMEVNNIWNLYRNTIILLFDCR